jgi:hypothetical protein
MYAILRRYTPEVAEAGVNVCYAELTGLRTFFKMSYKEIAERIRYDLSSEIGLPCVIRAGTVDGLEYAKNTLRRSKKARSISTYKEMNTLFVSPVSSPRRAVGTPTKRRAFTIPFLGKVK